MKKNTKILSVGGSIIIPKTGFNIPFLKKFKTLILRQIKKGDRFILVIGGGATCRKYQDAARQISSLTNEDLDWIGIHTTIYNAQFVRYMFKDVAYKHIITNPNKKVQTTKPVIIAAGWKPGFSTDRDAALLAKTYGAKELYNLSNISYVYDKDPNIYPEAKKLRYIDWQTLRDEIVGHTWEPGKSAPFDPIASKDAQKFGMKVGILDGTKLGEVKKAIDGKPFNGTIVE